ncbi:hypothetical protein A5892_07740 [Halotalea alkalilenta]|uniref:Beta-lactamase class A catalytic domain-containing protein n=2 Tax=Halotalea alkalilenta TaxID=376489 RepID=A0A172YDP4_9GAMM|nr:hypothetical protein A5892_07740 [Halotalea alkalilenta]
MEATSMRSIRLLPILASLCAACLLVPAHAEVAPTPAAAIEALFNGRASEPQRYASAFREQVSPQQVAEIVAGMERRLGGLKSIDTRRSGALLHFERGRVPARIALDAEGRISQLWFGVAELDDDIDTLAGLIQALPGDTALLVVADGEPLVSHNAQAPLAVGSAAKLSVLRALALAIEEQRLAWDQVVTLDPGWRSLPSGQLQEWPAGTPVTVATLAHLMIAISDNTATDALIHLVGRDAVEAISPRNVPFLTTRELFSLKADDAAGLRERWREGDIDARREILASLRDAPLPAVDSLSPDVTHEIEWFISAEELCELLDATHGSPSLSINPGLADPAQWQQVAYKGGSEPGVLNLSTRLVAADGRSHCVIASWNDDAALDQQALFDPYRGIIERLKGELK